MAKPRQRPLPSSFLSSTRARQLHPASIPTPPRPRPNAISRSRHRPDSALVSRHRFGCISGSRRYLRILTSPRVLLSDPGDPDPVLDLATALGIDSVSIRTPFRYRLPALGHFRAAPVLSVASGFLDSEPDSFSAPVLSAASGLPWLQQARLRLGLGPNPIGLGPDCPRPWPQLHQPRPRLPSSPALSETVFPDGCPQLHFQPSMALASPTPPRLGPNSIGLSPDYPRPQSQLHFWPQPLPRLLLASTEFEFPKDSAMLRPSLSPGGCLFKSYVHGSTCMPTCMGKGIIK